MTVTVLLFASYADAIGRSSLELDVRSGATVREVIDRVRAMGDATRLPATPMVAVNEQYASRDRELRVAEAAGVEEPVIPHHRDARHGRGKALSPCARLAGRETARNS